MEPHWPLVLQEGNKVVKHVCLRVLSINPPKEYKYAIFPPNLNTSQLSEGAHTLFGEGKIQTLFLWEDSLIHFAA